MERRETTKETSTTPPLHNPQGWGTRRKRPDAKSNLSHPPAKMALLPLGISGWGFKARATRAPTLAGLLALLGCHLPPALVHSLPNTLVDSSPNIGARRAMTAPSAEEDAAQRQKSQGLPEGDLAPAKERRQQPIPQVQHQFAAEEDK